jgi:site-specific DNA-methyltransferase (adenine-specific)
MFKYEWIWDKGVSGSFANAKYQPLKTHENILVFCNGKLNYQPQMVKRDKPAKIGGVRSGSKQGGREIVYNSKKLSDKKIYTDAFPKTVQYFSPRSKKLDRGLHPTQKPVALFEYLIKTYTNEGEIVLDNCIGSGTTAIAALNTGRFFIGIEKEEKYVGIARKRIAEHTQQLSIV